MNTEARGSSERGRAALYLRVSGETQTCENQRPEVLRLTQVRGMEIAALFEEKMSAAKARPQFDRMVIAAHRGEFDTVVVWSLDRFGRSMADNLNTILELDRIGVRVVSVREPWLDTAGPVRPLLIAILSWVAAQERTRLIERTKAGIARARAAGTRIGRPTATFDVQKAVALRAAGSSIREIARQLRVGAATVHRVLKARAVVVAAVEATVPEPPGAEVAEVHDTRQAA